MVFNTARCARRDQTLKAWTRFEIRIFPTPLDFKKYTDFYMFVLHPPTPPSIRFEIRILPTPPDFKKYTDLYMIALLFALPPAPSMLGRGAYKTFATSRYHDLLNFPPRSVFDTPVPSSLE